MRTIEFNSVVDNGVIPVPSEYSSLSNITVRVIVVPNGKAVKASPKKQPTFAEFEKQWAGAFKLSNDDYDDAKYHYLKEKYG
jgi:hypothetical protein